MVVKLARTSHTNRNRQGGRVRSEADGPGSHAATARHREPRLPNADRFTNTPDNAWHLFSSRQDTALTVAFLQGKQTPTVEFFGLDAVPNKLAASWRVDFANGCSLGDHRAAYRPKGQA